MRGESVSDASADAISARIEPYRQELRLHCYRLTGSLHEAEDLVQETLLRAWLRFATFRGTASLRTWLYTIATNPCLDLLRKRPARSLPPAVFPAADPRAPFPVPGVEASWLEPFPADWLADASSDPEARYTRSESVSLAFLAALQLLPPRQRAIVILRDVLDWRAAEVAPLLGVTVSATNSALHRARVTLGQHYHAEGSAAVWTTPPDAATDALLQRYVQAWENDDVEGLVALLQAEAILSMPPLPAWYAGREAIRELFARYIFGAWGAQRWRLVPTAANGLPAFACYHAAEPRGPYQAFGIQVPAFGRAASSGQIAELTFFGLSPELVVAFGFPPELPR